MAGGLKGISGTPGAGTRQRRNWQKFANEFALLLGAGLEITGDGYIAIDLATNPGLEFTGGDLQVDCKTGGHLAKDASGLYVDEASLDDVFVPYTGATAHVDLGAYNLTAATITGTTITDGALSINSGSITSGVAGTFSGTLQGGTVTDGTLTINSGSIASAVNGTFSGTVQAEHLYSTDDGVIADLLQAGRLQSADSTSSGDHSLSFGKREGLTGGSAVLTASGTGAIVLGYAYGQYDTASILSTADGSFAVGYARTMTGEALNAVIQATQDGAIAMGLADDATEPPGAALLEASGLGSVALGYAAGGSHKAIGAGSIALGTNCQANAIGTIAIGYEVLATGLYSLAIGKGFTNSTASTIKLGINAGDLTISATEMLWNGTAKLGDGGGTNYLQINATGDVTFAGSAGFYPVRIAQADEPNADTGELIIWRDTDDGKIYLIYNDTDSGQKKVELA